MIPFGPRFPLSPFSPGGPVDNKISYKYTLYIILYKYFGEFVNISNYFF